MVGVEGHEMAVLNGIEFNPLKPRTIVAGFKGAKNPDNNRAHTFLKRSFSGPTPRQALRWYRKHRQYLTCLQPLEPFNPQFIPPWDSNKDGGSGLAMTAQLKGCVT